jgi:hypothetical protein
MKKTLIALFVVEIIQGTGHGDYCTVTLKVYDFSSLPIRSLLPITFIVK